MRPQFSRWIGLGLMFLAVFGIQMFFGRSVTEPYMLPDEFGYLSNAAFLNGYDWSPLVAWSSFYHSGYSFLVAPLFWWFPSFQQVYKVALALNALLGAGVFLLACSTCRKLKPQLAFRDTLLIAFVISLYPALLCYSKLALAETLLVFLVWLGLHRLASGFGSDQSPSRMFRTGLLMAAPFLVHPRGIGISVAAFSMAGLLRLRNRIRTSQLMAFLVGVVLILGLTYLVNKFFLSQLWLRDLKEAEGPINTLSQAAGKTFLKELFSTHGLGRLVLTAAGQLFYLGSTTLGLALIGLIGICGLLKKSLFQTSSTIETRREAVLLQIVFSFLAIFAISILFCFRSERGDGYLYGRYTEAVLGPVLLWGMAWTLEQKKRTWITFSITALLLLGSGLLLQPRIHAAWEDQAFHLSHILAYFPFRTENWRIDLGEILQVLAIALACTTLILRVSPRLMLIGVASVYLWLTHVVIEKNIASSSLNRADSFSIPDWLQRQDPSAPVQFHVQAPDDNRVAERYQLRLLGQQIRPFRENPPVPGAAYIITRLATLQQKFPDALLADVDLQRRYVLCVLPGALRQQLEARKIPLYPPSMLLAHLDANDPLPQEAYRSRIELVSGNPQDPIVLDLQQDLRQQWFGEKTSIALRVTNASDLPWPTARDVAEKVQLGLFWVKSDALHNWLGETRVPLPWPMLPQSSHIVNIPLDFFTTPPTALAPGSYQLKVSPIQEGKDWFWKAGDPMLTLLIQVR